MKTSRVLGGISSSAFAGVALMISGLLLIPLNISTLGADVYGVWLTISVTATVLYYSDLGIGLAIIHYGSQFRARLVTLSYSSLLSCGVVWAFGIWLVVGACFAVISDLLLDSRFEAAGISTFTAGTLIGLGLLLLGALVIKPFESVLISAGYINYQRRSQVAGAVLRVVGTVFACVTFGDVVAVAAAEVVAMLLPPAISAGLVLKFRLATVKWTLVDVSTFRTLFSYSLRSFVTGMVGALVLQAGAIVAAIVGSPADVTYFTAAFRVYNSIRQIISWLTEPFRSMMSRLWRLDPVSAQSSLVLFLFVTYSVTITGCISIALASVDIVSVWLGENVPIGAVSLTVSILVMGLVLNVVHIPFIPALDGAGRPGIYFPLQVLWLVMYLAAAIPLGNQYGIVGIAVGLSAPLILLEPLYLWRALSALDLTFERWTWEALIPTAAVVAAGALTVGALSALGFIYDFDIQGWILGGVFGLGAVAAFACVSKRIGVERFRTLLSAEL
ncbi:hypothetical protein [Rhodococcus sp. HS-D2]|uniref:hypothetical protein n=1 Tax=Rhodococcus sp. HS-D2 TaxID=1384636 RepID=UPI000ABB4928|nr:hypothetical protein [Rhodococcus sp. HS-D2]